jgi:hypothetical protein
MATRSDLYLTLRLFLHNLGGAGALWRAILSEGTSFWYQIKQQFVNAPQLVRRSGWLDQTCTNTDKVGEQSGGLHLSRIVQNSGPDALQRLNPPRVNPLLDGANFGVWECPGAHRHLQVWPIQALCAGDGSREAGERCLRTVDCCLVDRLIESLDDERLVRSKDGLLEVAWPREVMVERAFADAQAAAEAIDAEATGALVSNSC